MIICAFMCVRVSALENSFSFQFFAMEHILYLFLFDFRYPSVTKNERELVSKTIFSLLSTAILPFNFEFFSHTFIFQLVTLTYTGAPSQLNCVNRSCSSLPLNGFTFSAHKQTNHTFIASIYCSLWRNCHRIWRRVLSAVFWYFIYIEHFSSLLWIE